MTGRFGVLGLPASTELTDDEVRAAWRRVAAATHPDRADGGDPAAFAAAAAAYTVLRSQAGRADALAAERSGGPRSAGPVPVRIRLPMQAAIVARRLAQGRPLRLALRVIAVAAASGLAIAAVGWQPASAVVVGALTWLLRTGWGDLGRRRPDIGAGRPARRPGPSSGRS
jgi:curved DNA-binding protein CbpA